MCLDFHPQHPNLLALGCYDGSVSVYDVRRPTKPLYSSTAANGKHTDPVWEIFWQVHAQPSAAGIGDACDVHLAPQIALLTSDSFDCALV